MKRLLLIAAAVLSALELCAQDVSAQQEKKRRIEEEISFINGQLKGLTTKQKATTKNLTLIKRKAAGRRTLIKQLDRRIRELDSQIAQKSAAIADLKANLDTLEAYYARLVYNCYKNRDTKVWFMYVLASEDIGQGWRRLRYMKNLSEAATAQGRRIIAAREELEREKAALEASLKESREMKKLRSAEYSRLLKEEQESKAVIRTITKDRKKYRKELDVKRREVENLNREIERILRGTVKKAAKKGLSAAEVALSGEFQQNRGRLGWPVSPAVVSESFGVHYHPVYKNIRLPENNGVTISTSKKAKVMSVFRGVVKQIVVMPGYNHCILIQHGGYYTFYCKLDNVLVKPGQEVEAGEVLGTLEPEGRGSTLHFQIWEGTSKQNPEHWLR